MATRRVSSQSQLLRSGTMLPTQRTQYSAHAVPQVQSSRAGLEGMGDAFARFFGSAQSALGNLQQIAHEGELRRIEEENEAQQVQATNDFYSGRDMDQSLMNDDDYMDTYRGLQANRVANGSARDFMAWYETDFLPNNPMGDLDQARDMWVQQNLMGISDPEVQAQALSHFYQRTETMLSTHMENTIRMERAQNWQTLSEALYDDIESGSLNSAGVEWYIEAARRLDPLNFMEAAPRIVATMMASVRNNPAHGQQIIQLLSQQGTGVNGRSFAESFPDAFADFQSGALNAYIQTNTLEEREYFQGIEDTIINTPNMTTADIASLTAQIQYGEQRYGAANRADQLRGVLASQMNQIAQGQADLSMMRTIMNTPGFTDASFVREHFGDYLQDEYGTQNILDIPPSRLARDLSRLDGVVPEDISASLSEALMNGNNPEAQQRALEILTTLEATRDTPYARRFLSSDADRYFNQVMGHLEAQVPVTEALARVHEARGLGVDPSEVDWRQVTNTTTTGDAMTSIDRTIDGQIQTYLDTNGWVTGAFTQNVNLPTRTLTQIREYAQLIYAERGETDGFTMDMAVQQAVEHFMPMAEMVGTLDHPSIILLDPDEMLVPDENGQMVPRVQLSTQAQVPGTGAVVNTRQIYEDELNQLTEIAPWVFEGGTSSEVGLGYQTRVPGAWTVRQNGNPVSFAVDEALTYDGTHYVFPETAAEVEAMFDGVLPEGFGFVANRDSFGELIGWDLMYRPHYNGEDRTLSDMAETHVLSQVRTPEMELRDMAMAMMLSEEFRGLTPATTGVNNSMPQFRDAIEIFEFFDNEMTRGIQQQGHRFITRHATQYDDTYRARRQQLLVNSEALHTRAYDDRTGRNMQPGQSAEGYVTVGIGFNMDRAGARDTWSEVFGDDGPDFEAVYQGDATISEAQARRLFDHDMVYFENVVTDAAGGRTLREHQHLALMSVAYNSPRSVEEMSEALASGDDQAVMNAILYDSYNPDHPQAVAIRSRRYQEARLFAGDNPVLLMGLPPVDEYLGQRGVTNDILGGLGMGIGSFVADPSTDMRRIQPGRHTIQVSGDRTASPQITGVVASAVETVLGPGARVEISSGHRPGDHGSQHSTSHAADFAIYDENGTRLRWDNERVQQVMMVAAQHGALGFGAGPTYMSGNSFHIDMGTGGMIAPRRGGINVWSDDDNGPSDSGPGAAQWLQLLQQSRQTVN